MVKYELDFVCQLVYNKNKELILKKKVLEQELNRLGWYKCREGSKHERWTNGKGEFETLPRHREIGDTLAKKIIKHAKQLPSK